MGKHRGTYSAPSYMLPSGTWVTHWPMSGWWSKFYAGLSYTTIHNRQYGTRILPFMAPSHRGKRDDAQLLALRRLI